MSPDDVFYLSYSGRKSYLGCPQHYWHRYVQKTEVRSDPRTSFFGSMIGKVFEWFYERLLWAEPDPEAATISLIPEAVSAVLSESGFERFSDPAYVSNVEDDLRQFVPPAVGMIRGHRLLSPNSVAELKLNVTYNNPARGFPMRLGGRSDFVHYFSRTDVWILDGKGSRHREKFVDSEQVIWYAVQHYLKFGVAPSRLGFIYWRFPNDPVQWVEYDSQSIRDSLDLTFDVARKIRLKVFDPKPSDTCKMCDYHSLCPDGTRYLAERKVEAGNRIDGSIFEIDYVS